MTQGGLSQQQTQPLIFKKTLEKAGYFWRLISQRGGRLKNAPF
jgi:hypothetical protein